ncbi:hypothetical protein Back11_54370 [Paenibacillus baekrokdamisoli]|uniref:Uncharacterized protein n=1 Tax=Paenibacillus baekrokdamisoli TaxID=1712516 RepID=A0A3G9J0M1_9BACL|nr:hypothetical protein Back11_54370 [Paenibacillus baekrokdamisoli]
MLTFELAWSETGYFAERVRKLRTVRKPAVLGDGAHRHIGRKHHLFGMLDSFVDDVAHRRFAGFHFEQMSEMIVAVTGQIGEGRQVNLLLEIFIDEIFDVLE